VRGLSLPILMAATAWAGTTISEDDEFKQAVNYVFSGNIEGKTLNYCPQSLTKISASYRSRLTASTRVHRRSACAGPAVGHITGIQIALDQRSSPQADRYLGAHGNRVPSLSKPTRPESHIAARPTCHHSDRRPEFAVHLPAGRNWPRSGRSRFDPA
jgi:hypothetical protein